MDHEKVLESKARSGCSGHEKTKSQTAVIIQPTNFLRYLVEVRREGCLARILAEGDKAVADLRMISDEGLMIDNALSWVDRVTAEIA